MTLLDELLARNHDRSPQELDAELKMHAADAFDWHTALASGAQASALGEMQRLYGIGASRASAPSPQT